MSEAILRLARDQRRVARVVYQTFVDHFPATEDMEALRQRVSDVTGCEETLATVKRALQEARRKIGDLLKARQL